MDACDRPRLSPLLYTWIDRNRTGLEIAPFEGWYNAETCLSQIRSIRKVFRFGGFDGFRVDSRGMKGISFLNNFELHFAIITSWCWLWNDLRRILKIRLFRFLCFAEMNKCNNKQIWIVNSEETMFLIM